MADMATKASTVLPAEIRLGLASRTRRDSLYPMPLAKTRNGSGSSPNPLCEGGTADFPLANAPWRGDQ